MKKILFIVTLFLFFMTSYGKNDPKVFKVPYINYGASAVSGDTVWLQAVYSDKETAILEKRLLSTKELLSSNENVDFSGAVTDQNIKIDSSGNVWIYSSSYSSTGIQVLNGENITVINTDSGLPSNRVYDVLFDADTVWAATYAGLCKMYDGIFVTYTTGDGLPDNEVRALGMDSKHNLWLGIYDYSYGGLVKWDGTNWTTLNKSNGLGYRSDYGYGTNYVFSVFVDDNDTVYAGTQYGISKLVEDTLISLDFFEGQNVQKFLIKDNNDIWATDYNGNLIISTETKDTLISYYNLANSRIISLISSGTNIIAVSNYGIFELQDDFTFTDFTLGYTNGQLNEIAIDAENNLWVATDNNYLIYVKDSNDNWYLEQPQQGMERYSVTSLKVAQDGSIWVGTHGNGIFIKKQDTWERLYSGNHTEIQSDNITDITFDNQSNAWFTTANGLYMYDGSSITGLFSADGLEDNSLTDVAVDADGHVWLAYYYTSLGLSEWDGSSFTTYTTSDGLVDTYIIDLETDYDNNLWIGAYDGLSVLNIETMKFENYDLTDEDWTYAGVGVIHTDAYGDMYVTSDSYFFLSVFEDNTINTYEIDLDSYNSETVVATAHDKDNDIWFATSQAGVYFLRQPPIVDFTYTDTICLADTLSLFNNSPEELVSYKWKIQDSVYSIENAEHTFSTAGTYSITFTAANDLDTNFITKQVVVLPTPEFEIISTGGAAICENEFTSLSLVGITKTDSVNWHISDGKSIIADSAGDYSVTVINQYGCSAAKNYVISQNPAPAVNITSNAEDNEICPDAQFTLKVQTEANVLAWSTLETTETIETNEAGNYSVTVTDDLGCENSAKITITEKTPFQEQIGVVTASEKSELLIVAWGKTADAEISSYNVYREEANGDSLIGNVSFSDPGLFRDTTANFNKRSYTYRITTIDECGTESDIEECTPHSSMHLLKFAYGNNFQLYWSKYEGTDVSSYTIYQTSDGTNLEFIESVPSTNNTYVIENYDTDKEFRVGVDLTDTIYPSKLKSDSGPFSQSLSNISEAELNSSAEEPLQAEFVLYPVPVSSTLNIGILGEEMTEYMVHIVNTNGSIVATKQASGATASIQFDVSDLPAGSYAVLLTADNKQKSKIFIKR